MKSTCNQLFVYGSLRRGFRSEAYNYISKYFTFVSTGKVKGVIWDTGSYPVATPSTEDSFIKGELYKIKNEEEFFWAIAQLDDYEGVSAEQDEHIFYKREKTTVLLENGKKSEAWVYWFTGDTFGKPVFTTEDMMEYYEIKNLNRPGNE